MSEIHSSQDSPAVVRWMADVIPLRRPSDDITDHDFARQVVARASVDGEFELARSHAARSRDARYRRLLGLADVLAATVTLLFTIELMGDDRMHASIYLAIPLVVAVYKVAGLYDRDELRLRKTTLDETPALLQGATLFTLLLAIFEEPFVVGQLGDSQLLAIWVGLLGSGIIARLAARAIALRITEPDRCLVIGGAGSALRLRAKLDESPQVSATVVGRVPLEAEEWADPTVLGALCDLEAVIVSNNIHRVVIAPRSSDSESLLEVIQSVKALGVKVSVLPRLFEVVGSSVEFDHIEGMTLLGVRRFGLTQSSSLVKRGLDIVGATFGLLVLSPLLAAIAVAIRIDSGGPIFFRQTRVGRRGHYFSMLKFRSMNDNAEAEKDALRGLNQADGLFKIGDDPRVTRVGRMLRRASLDELPQLWNVLRGEMSLVGPRPLVVDEDERVAGWHRRRLQLKPGITGHWQVMGSTRIPLREMVTIDYLYVANWSLWNDVKILLRTVPHVLARRGM